MTAPDNLRYTKLRLNTGSSCHARLGFGTLIPDPVATKSCHHGGPGSGLSRDRHRRAATEIESEVGQAMQEVFKVGKINRQDVFVITKLWNTNHRPRYVKPACQASLKKLQLDSIDLYLIHTPFAFQPGDDQDPQRFQRQGDL